MNIIGDLQAKLDAEYIKLPVDADGVPIHIGDNVRLNPSGGIFTVRGVGVNTAGNPVMWGVRESNTQTTRHRIDDDVRHVQPDTVESLLEEFGRILVPENAQDGLPEFVERYAERIRRVVEHG